MPPGGKRAGAGRPKGSGKFKEETKAVRIPVSEIQNVLQYIQGTSYSLPFYRDAISAGFPSPTESDFEEKIDLNTLLIKHPAATFLLRVSGSSMIKAGIHHNDIVVVDRSIPPAHGKIVIASVNGELTIKRLHIEGKITRLVAENDSYKPIDVSEDMDLRFWGTVTSVIHPL